jgi:hypothetical protein
MITINLGKARDIHRDRIRQARAPKLEQLDTAFQRELEKPKPNTAAIAAQKQALRDAPASPAIDVAETTEDLKAAWPADLLGASPYTATANEDTNA